MTRAAQRPPVHVRLRCDADGPCNFHLERAADPGTVASVPAPKCPWYCDADGCDQEATVEPRGDGLTYCAWHAAQALAAS